MFALRHRLMRHESLKRLAAAGVLDSAGDQSDSAYLLRLLAFELLLKVVIEGSIRQTVRGHDYQTLFSRLLDTQQAEILRMAGDRIGPSALNSNYQMVLQDLGRNFVNLRYPYEKYNDITPENYAKRGEEWIAAGGHVSDADYRYHPEELLGLTAALQRVVDVS